jgi:hypothetical protein
VIRDRKSLQHQKQLPEVLHAEVKSRDKKMSEPAERSVGGKRHLAGGEDPESDVSPKKLSAEAHRCVACGAAFQHSQDLLEHLSGSAEDHQGRNVFSSTRKLVDRTFVELIRRRIFVDKALDQSAFVPDLS